MSGGHPSIASAVRVCCRFGPRDERDLGGTRPSGAHGGCLAAPGRLLPSRVRPSVGPVGLRREPRDGESHRAHGRQTFLYNQPRPRRFCATSARNAHATTPSRCSTGQSDGGPGGTNLARSWPGESSRSAASCVSMRTILPNADGQTAQTVAGSPDRGVECRPRSIVQVGAGTSAHNVDRERRVARRIAYMGCIGPSAGRPHPAIRLVLALGRISRGSTPRRRLAAMSRWRRD